MGRGWHRPITRSQALALGLLGLFVGVAAGVVALVADWGGGVLGLLAVAGIVYGVIESRRQRRRRA